MGALADELTTVLTEPGHVAAARETAAWVMERAGRRCECAGACGASHSKSGGRCQREGSWPPRLSGPALVVAPREPAAGVDRLIAAARLPREALAAWCTSCLAAVDRATDRAAAEEAAAAQPALWPATTNGEEEGP